MEMGFVNKWFKWSKLVLAMVMVQMFVAGMNLLSKVILSEGSFIFALMAYRHVVAAICVAPFALSLERIKEHKLSWSVWFWLFANALTGITAAVALFYYGLRDTTATYAANFLNLIPIATFVLSTITGPMHEITFSTDDKPKLLSQETEQLKTALEKEVLKIEDQVQHKHCC